MKSGSKPKKHHKQVPQSSDLPKELPQEIWEYLFSCFCSLPDFIKIQRICKEWDQLINQICSRRLQIEPSLIKKHPFSPLKNLINMQHYTSVYVEHEARIINAFYGRIDLSIEDFTLQSILSILYGIACAMGYRLPEEIKQRTDDLYPLIRKEALKCSAITGDLDSFKKYYPLCSSIQQRFATRFAIEHNHLPIVAFVMESTSIAYIEEVISLPKSPQNLPPRMLTFVYNAKKEAMKREVETKREEPNPPPRERFRCSMM